MDFKNRLMPVRAEQGERATLKVDEKYTCVTIPIEYTSQTITIIILQYIYKSCKVVKKVNLKFHIFLIKRGRGTGPMKPQQPVFNE